MGFDAAVPIPQLVGQGTMFDAWSSTSSLPLVSASAELESTVSWDAAADLPQLIVDGATGGYTGDVALPALAAAATVALAQDWDGAATMRPVSAASQIAPGVFWDASGVVPAVRVKGSVLAAALFDAGVTLPPLAAEAEYLLPLSLSAAARLPALTGTGVLSAALAATFAAWIVNTRTRGAAEYSGYDFTGLARHQKRYFGCNENGIFELTGKTDDGDPIQASATSGVSTAGTDYAKHFPYAYFETRCDGELEFLLTADPSATAITTVYPVEQNRIGLSKGVRGKHVQIGVRNVDGSDFDLARIVLDVSPSTSRRGG